MQINAKMQEFLPFLGGRNRKDANLQELFEDWRLMGEFSGKACRFAGILNLRPQMGKKPADLQEFLIYGLKWEKSLQICRNF